MSPIGRIFSVLNLVLAAVFLAWASTTLGTSQDYKDKYEAEQSAKEQLELELNSQLSSLRQDLDTSQGEANRWKADLDNSRNDASRLGRDLDNARTENGTLNTSVDRLSNSYDSIQAQNRDLVSQKDQAFQARVDAEGRADDSDSGAQTARTALEDAKATNLELRNTISDLEIAVAQGGKQVDSLETQLAQMFDYTGATIGDIIPQKRINGAVLKVLYDVPPGLVAINKGSVDGVVRGNTFEIYNGLIYKGRVRVENVRDDMCTCLVLDTVDGYTINQGDLAATVL